MTFAEDLQRAGLPVERVEHVVLAFFGVRGEFPIGELIDPARRERLLAENLAVIEGMR